MLNLKPSWKVLNPTLVHNPPLPLLLLPPLHPAFQLQSIDVHFLSRGATSRLVRNLRVVSTKLYVFPTCKAYSADQKSPGFHSHGKRTTHRVQLFTPAQRPALEFPRSSFFSLRETQTCSKDGRRETADEESP